MRECVEGNVVGFLQFMKSGPLILLPLLLCQYHWYINVCSVLARHSLAMAICEDREKQAKLTLTDRRGKQYVVVEVDFSLKIR